MSKVTLTNLVNLENQTTAVTTINANNAAITTAMNNTLSRNGASPNTMSANLDMNSYAILNLPAPVSNLSPVRLSDLRNAVLGTVPVGSAATSITLTPASAPALGLDVHSPNAVPFFPESENPSLVSIYTGDSSAKVTDANPTVGISRYEGIHSETTGGQNAGLYVSSTGNNTSDLVINSQCNGITAKATQIGSGDVCGGYFVGIQNGTAFRGQPGVAYGVFSAVETDVNNGSAIAIETFTANKGGPDHNQGQSTPNSLGLNIQAFGFGAYRCGTAILIGGSGTWDCGIEFSQVRTSMMFAATDSVDILRGQAAHTDGVNFVNATFSGNAWASPGCQIDGTGTPLFLASLSMPSGGTTGKGVKLTSTSNFGIFFGSGAPTLSAAKGSLYLRSDGTTTTSRAYINTNGSTTWTALTTAA